MTAAAMGKLGECQLLFNKKQNKTKCSDYFGNPYNSIQADKQLLIIILIRELRLVISCFVTT